MTYADFGFYTNHYNLKNYNSSFRFSALKLSNKYNFIQNVISCLKTEQYCNKIFAEELSLFLQTDP